MAFDAIVIGAGVIGSSVALELQRDELAVLVVDRGTAVGGESTSASSAVIRFSYSTLDGVIAAWESAHAWSAWEEHLGFLDGPAARFHRIGMIHLREPDDPMGAMAQLFDRAGVPYELWSPDELALRYGALDVGSFAPPRLPSDPDFFADARGRLGALYQPDAGFIDDPQLAARNLMDAARHHGAELRLRAAVTEIDIEGGRVRGVTLGGVERIEAPVIVNCAGPWSSKINELAGSLDDMRIRTRALRQTVASAAAPPGFGVGSGGSTIADGDLGTYSRPQPGGSYLIGGVEAACDPLEWVDDPDPGTGPPDPEMFEALTYRMARRLPGFQVPRRPQGLSHHYDVSDDWVPIYDRSAIDGYYQAIGTSGNQFKNAPIAGQILAAIVGACEAGHDHDSDPVQLLCPHTGQRLDTGQFSRLRDPAATGGNVLG